MATRRAFAAVPTAAAALLAATTGGFQPALSSAGGLQYRRLAYGADGCLAGEEITTPQECEEALQKLGLPSAPAAIVAMERIPSFCSVREAVKGGGEHMHFNAAVGGRGHVDLAPVCRGTADTPKVRAVASDLPKKDVMSPNFERLPYGASGCPDATEIKNPEECATALMELGLPVEPVAVLSMESLPRGCSVREAAAGSGEHLHFNAAQLGRGRVDLAPVCRRVGDGVGQPHSLEGRPSEEAHVAGYERLPYGRNGCDAGMEVSTPEECAQALAELGLPVQPAAVFAKDGLPRFCSVREAVTADGEHMHFNTGGTGGARQDLAPVCRRATRETSANVELKGKYVRLEYGASGCPTGADIVSPDECKEALKALGILAEPHAMVSMDRIPRFCSVREIAAGSGEHMHFNAAPNGRGRVDLAPVCLRTEAEEAHTSAAGFRFVRLAYGAGGCPVGTEIETPEECALAVTELGFPVDPVAIVAAPSIPRRCSIREAVVAGGEHLHFNSAEVGRGRPDLAPVCRARREQREEL
eukprot:TRINITY_DN54178_c0_g1_i1.p1 TRINITY_DN54178_c0_g1~~TRINITY_DN54178_c0_g1_i1.p1  ORF type:complete len:549 (+),score=97.77 TRINITY_DN54178_c0_g1_i1:61-1647(+)